MRMIAVNEAIGFTMCRVQVVMRAKVEELVGLSATPDSVHDRGVEAAALSTRCSYFLAWSNVATSTLASFGWKMGFACFVALQGEGALVDGWPCVGAVVPRKRRVALSGAGAIGW